jgi:histone-lysine N-methyltransferase SETD1
LIRGRLADLREKRYEQIGIYSSYFFRINDHWVIDATMKGNLSRFINHSCEPNCTASVLVENGKHKIAIYADKYIEVGTELSYDYKFPIEVVKIKCLCGAEKCKGYLN